MKNLFKNLMLVAVAAMAFTACTETNEEVNAVSEKSVINGVAVIENDDTRSGFVGSETTENEDGTTTTLYKSAWDGTELIKVFGDNGEEKVVEIDADGKFTVAFDSAPNGFTVVSPAEAWTSNSSCTIAKEQTPRENSVDPAVHVLQSQWTATANASYVQMSLQNACYGKMTIKDAVEIEQVEIDLKGLKYHSYEDTLSYTLNATYVKDNTFWFAIEVPMTITEFTVTASCTDGKTLTKSVTIPEDRELKFNWGRVSTFSVSDLVEYKEPAKFVSAEWDGTNYTDCYINFKGGNDLLDLRLNFYYIVESNWEIATGEYSISASSGCIYPGYYSTYGNSNLGSGTVKITNNGNGNYLFEFINIKDESGTEVIEYATYSGAIVLRESIASPNITVKAIDSTSITFAWEAVAGAKDYTVTFNGVSETITACEYTISDLYPFTDYSIGVVTNPEDTAIYKQSQEASKVATTLPSSDMVADFSYTYDKMEVRAGYSNAYKFYNSANAAEYLYLQFNVDILTLAPGIYTYSAYNGIQYGSASAFNIPGYPNGGYVEHWMQDSNLVVVEVGEYLTVTTYCRRYITGYGDALYKSVWTNDPSALPVERIALATPVVNATIVDEKNVTVTWNEVANAANYTVSVNGTVVEEANTTRTYTIEGAYSTEYTIAVVANPVANSEEYKASEAGTTTVTTNADPNAGGGGATVPEGYIEMAQCIYYGDLMGAGLADEFVLLSADGKNKLFFNFNNATTDPNYIPTGEYTLSRPGATGNTFNMNTTSDTTIINGVSYANGVDTNSGSTMSVVSEGKGGVHEIKLTIINNQGTNKFYFKGTIN